MIGQMIINLHERIKLIEDSKERYHQRGQITVLQNEFEELIQEHDKFIDEFKKGNEEIKRLIKKANEGGMS